MDVGTYGQKLLGSWVVYASINGTGDLVCMTQFPDNDDVVMAVYAVKTRMAFRYGVLSDLYISHKVALSD